MLGVLNPTQQVGTAIVQEGVAGQPATTFQEVEQCWPALREMSPHVSMHAQPSHRPACCAALCWQPEGPDCTGAHQVPSRMREPTMQAMPPPLSSITYMEGGW